ncbi:hypothetical protein SV7mr_01260 [Stieleria bergensis]|uniref:Uncharacterized protein n=1 Tax=Stieleria bergensis TaxID=2528025 RepID=A0A517SNE7_9BACT|nr:hypothetical protein SV7mr_01260 [Planctomycetes bacterium SV_7m_r]
MQGGRLPTGAPETRNGTARHSNCVDRFGQLQSAMGCSCSVVLRKGIDFESRVAAMSDQGERWCRQRIDEHAARSQMLNRICLNPAPAALFLCLGALFWCVEPHRLDQPAGSSRERLPRSILAPITEAGSVVTIGETRRSGGGMRSDGSRRLGHRIVSSGNTSRHLATHPGG